jgi:hypothetical protein
MVSGGIGMTDKEIIKALECCEDSYSSRKCLECPYYCCNAKKDCVDEMKCDALDLINRQQAEIENYIKVAEYQQNLTVKKSFEIKELKAEIERLTARNFELAEKGEKVVIAFKNAKSEAIKEFAGLVDKDIDKKLSESIKAQNPHLYLIHQIVKDRLKEMVGDNNAE